MTCSPELPNPALCEEISRLLYTTLITAQTQHSKLLTESCRSWLETTSQETQTAKITVLLQQQPDVPALLRAINHVLGKFFISDFQGSRAHSQVLQRVQGLIAGRATQTATPFIGEAEKVQARQRNGADGKSPNSGWAGLLLVDAENMTPPKALEAFLQDLGQYPIRHRLAFGNWRNLGGRDREFHQRGYHMVHVPAGKNSADIKMSLDASLISLWNPSVREVFICSTDTDLLHLGHTLLNLGIVPYRVSRQHDRFDVLNIANQTTQIFYLPQASQEAEGDVLTKDAPLPETANAPKNQDGENPAPVTVPTVAQMQRWLKILILQEQQANPGQPITIGRLGELFRQRNQIAANQALKANSDYKTLKQFLAAHDVFELSPLPDGQHMEVRLKAPASEPTIVDQGSQLSTPGAAPKKIADAHTLEQALVKLLWSLSSGQSGSQVSLSAMGTHFAQVHKEPLSKVLKRIGEPKGLPKFFAKCRSLRLQKQGNDWRVALACVS